DPARPPDSPPGDRPPVDMSPVIKLIATSVAPGTWRDLDERGQPLDAKGRPRGGASPDDVRKVGSITPFHLSASLIIRQTPEAHDQIADRLRLVRHFVFEREPQSATEAPEPSKPSPTPRAPTGPGPGGAARPREEADDDLLRNEELAMKLAEARAVTESLPAQIQILERKLAAWEELLKKHNYGVPAELGREPTEQEKKVSEAI